MDTRGRNTNLFSNQKGGENGTKKDGEGETMGFGTWV
jgi:hypothetical protein